MRRIAVLMTCHNRRETTLRCLGSLREQWERKVGVGVGVGQWKLDVYLVDDGSTDGTSAAVREWEKKWEKEVGVGKIHIIKGSGHDYWAKGMCRAWQEAVGASPPTQNSHYDAFLWLNDDVVLRSDAMETLLADEAKTHGVIVGTCSQDANELAVSYSATDERDCNVFPSGSPQPMHGWFNGNCVLVPREVYEQVGMLDAAYSHGRADYDYAERLKRAGIPFYASSRFVGVCDKDWKRKPHPKTLRERFAQLFQPGYFNLADMWRYRIRYYGFCRAVISCAHLVAIQLRGWADT